MFITLYYVWAPLYAYHPFRYKNPDFPIISTRWKHSEEIYSLQSPYVRLHPLFTFKTHDFYPYLIPQEGALCDTHNITNKALSKAIEHTVHELKTKKKRIRRNKKLAFFKILQDKNFNYKKSCGLIVLKCKYMPLILKLFMESPATLLQSATGLEPLFFFYMGGGANRHLSGFTRLKNREILIKKISKLPRWAEHVSFPRKWFWLPENQEDIIITGKNIAGNSSIETNIPSVYGIIADEIDIHNQTQELSTRTKGKIIMQLCNDLDMYVDPHEKNYAFMKDSNKHTFKIIIVDTEHFPTMVGLLDRKKFKTHSQWYIFLAGKCFHDMYLQTKRDLFENQSKASKLALS